MRTPLLERFANPGAEGRLFMDAAEWFFRWEEAG